MKIFLIFASLIFLLNFISASCNETQIDINSATLEELDALSGIGPAYGQNIIDSRPYQTLDDLINVSGIGNKTLEKIKSQGLACVGVYEKLEKKNETAQIEINASVVENTPEKIQEIPKQIETEPQTIRLTSDATKDIKSERNLGNLYKNKIFWLIVFGLFVGVLLAVKKYREKRNEF